MSTKTKKVSIGTTAGIAAIGSLPAIFTAFGMLGVSLTICGIVAITVLVVKELRKK